MKTMKTPYNLGQFPGYNIPEMLFRHRRGLGMTQAQIAALLNVDVSTYSAWERGDHGMGMTSFSRWLRAFGLVVTALVLRRTTGIDRLARTV